MARRAIAIILLGTLYFGMSPPPLVRIDNNMIYLEPRRTFDEAIIGTNEETQQIIYDYDKLIDAIINKLQKQDDHISNEEAYEMAVDHIDHNIEGMRPNYKHWPIIRRDTDDE